MACVFENPLGSFSHAAGSVSRNGVIDFRDFACYGHATDLHLKNQTWRFQQIACCGRQHGNRLNKIGLSDNILKCLNTTPSRINHQLIRAKRRRSQHEILVAENTDVLCKSRFDLCSFASRLLAKLSLGFCASLMEGV